MGYGQGMQLAAGSDGPRPGQAAPGTGTERHAQRGDHPSCCTSSRPPTPQAPAQDTGTPAAGRVRTKDARALPGQRILTTLREMERTRPRSWPPPPLGVLPSPTQHGGAEHLVEGFRRSPDGRSLEALLHSPAPEDPKACCSSEAPQNRASCPEEVRCAWVLSGVGGGHSQAAQGTQAWRTRRAEHSRSWSAGARS